MANVAFIFGSFANIPDGKLTFEGDARASGDVISLTKLDVDPVTEPFRVGRVLYSPPIQFWDQRSEAIFETTITFKISPKANVVLADGIAFFIAPVRTAFPQDKSTAGGNLGIFNADGTHPKLVAVEFDTHVNAFENDLPGPHIGIDIQSIKSKRTTDMKEEDFSGKKVTATITYRDHNLTVVAFTDKKTFRVSHDIDLRDILTETVQVGISASTGLAAEEHLIYSWGFASALVRSNV